METGELQCSWANVGKTGVSVTSVNVTSVNVTSGVLTLSTSCLSHPQSPTPQTYKHSLTLPATFLLFFHEKRLKSDRKFQQIFFSLIH